MLQFFKSKIIFFLVLIITLYIIIYLWSKIECRCYKLKVFNVSNQKNNESLKIVFITDFHNKIYRNDYSDIIDSIISSAPNYIVLGGDFVDFSSFNNYFNNVHYKNSIRFLNILSNKLREYADNKNSNFKGIFFGFGNHELRLKNRDDNEKLKKIYDSFIDCLKDNDIKILDNNTYRLTDGITISGLSLYDGYYRNAFSKKLEIDHIDDAIIKKEFNELRNTDYNIMVFHKPDYCEDFIDYGFDLVLSGHNHGGLIMFPLVGPIFSPDLKLFPKYNYGLYDYKDGNLIVSSGLGEHFIKLRVNNLPEICLINING